MLTPILIACSLGLGQAGRTDGGQWLLVPQLGRGQELVYRGTFTEERLDGGVQFSRDYRLETRVFMLEHAGREVEAAFFTQMQPRPARPEGNLGPEPTSVRLELARIEAHGRVRPAEGVSLLVPLEGPASIEVGFFVEVPAQQVYRGRTWEVAEPGRTPRTWRVDGTEVVGGAVCVKLVGLQQSEDWDRPRADSTAWRRQDVVWLNPRTGYAVRLERTIDRRDPARRDPSQRSTTRYDLESSLQYPGQLWEDRRREINLAWSLNATLKPLLQRAGQVGPRPFEAILAKIANHRDYQAPTPYRQALVQVSRQAEAGKRGESPPELPIPEVEPVALHLALNRPAPDFVAPDLVNRSTARLKNWLGKPILMIFYHPTSLTGTEILRFAQSIQEKYQGGVTVLALACTDDQAAVLEQRDKLGLAFPLLSGNGLRLTYAVETTPKLVVLDKDGIVRYSQVGWGSESPQVIHDALHPYLQPPRALPE